MDSLIARMIAERAHRGQTDKSGAPYLEHVLRVAAAVPEPARVVAFLHDVVEDHPETWGIDRLSSEEYLRATFRANVYPLFGGQITSLVAITRQPHESYSAYLDRVCADRIATEVKLRDLQDNLAPARLLQVDAATRQRLLTKYLVGLDRVTKALSYHITRPALATVPAPE